MSKEIGTKKIVHIFQGYSYHLTPNISSSFLKNLPEYNHIIVLYGPRNMNKDIYSSLYSKSSFNDYIYCCNLFQLARIFIRYRKDVIIFHAGMYSWKFLAFFLRCNNINWVCWGHGASVGISFLGKRITALKQFLYKQFKTIDVLIPQDKISIEKYYQVPAENIWNISYMGNFSEENTDLYDKLRKTTTFPKNGKPLVLLGNNPSNIPNYIDLLKQLSIFKGKILVQCMLHYSLEKNKLYYELIELGKSIFGEDFRSNEEFYEFKDYILYMSKCDIYICSGKQQTGLGAINTCLRLGKKIYITGKNYDWITNHYKAIVYRCDDINENLTYESFVKELSVEEKEYNNKCLDSSTSEVSIVKHWQKYFDFLLNT